MKINLTTRFIFLFLLVLCGATSAQTINFNVDARGVPGIAMGSQPVSQTDVTILTLPVNTGLKFQLNNPTKAPVVITIKAKNDVPPGYHSALQVNNLQTLFLKVNPIVTDDALNLHIDSLSQSLNTPFSVSIANTVTHITFIATFAPVIAKGLAPGAAPLAGGTVQPAMTNAPVVQTTPAAPVYVPGSAVYDALKLSVAANVTETDLKTIIGYYYPKASIGSTQDVLNAVAHTPFLDSTITKGYTQRLKASPLGTAQSAQSIISSLSLSSIGGLDVTNLADGISKFLLTRAQDELNIAFFQRLKNALTANPDLVTLFPQTVNLLTSIGGQDFDYQRLLQNLREAFKSDISSLDNNLPGIIKNHPAYFNGHHDLAAAIIGGCYVTSQLRAQVHPGDIIANYPVNSLDSVSPVYVKGSVQTLQLLSQSVRDTSSDNYWVSIKYMRQLVNNTTALKIYLGLVYQEAINDYQGVNYGNGVTFTDVLSAAAPSITTDLNTLNAYKVFILQLGEKTEALNQMIKSYQKPASDSLAVELYKKYFDATTGFIQYATKAATLPGVNILMPNAPVYAQDVQHYLGIGQSVSDLVIDINRKNYSAAINKAAYILTRQLNIDTALKAEVDTAVAKVTAINAQINNGHLVGAALNTAKVNLGKWNAKKDSASVNIQFISYFIKYGAFMSAIATAKTADEVNSAIAAFALPVGSYAVKQHSLCNVSLNGYVGYALDFDTFGFGHQYANGVYAPVGVSVSKGRIFKNKGGAFTLFASVIDVGGLVAYHLSDGTTNNLNQQIKLESIISPSAQVFFDIPGLPISAGAGWRLTPKLSYSDGTINVVKPPRSVFNVSFLIDIPIITLYNKPK